MKAKLVKKTEGWYNLYNGEIGIGSTHEELQGYKLSLKNCQAIELGYDFDELARQEAEKLYDKTKHEDYSVWEYLVSGEVESIKIGFQKALELMGDKKYSTEFILHLVPIVLEKHKVLNITEFNDWYNSDFLKMIFDRIEWDVEIEMEKAPIKMPGIMVFTKEPKVDEEGCIILKRL